MEIFGYLDLFLGAFLNVICCLTIIKKIFKTKIIKNKYKIYIYIIIVAIGIALINEFNKNMFKAVFTIPLIAISVFKVFDVKISKSLYYTIVASFYMLIGEIFISLIVSLLSIDISFVQSNVLGKTLGNILVIVSTLPFLYIKYIANVFIKMERRKLSEKTINTVFIVFLIIGSAFVFKSSTNLENLIMTIMNMIIFFVFIFLLYISFSETQKVNQISDEYNSLLNYLDKYEKEIVEKRKIVHDFRNQLIVINGYINDKEKLKQYMNSIIEEQKNIKETKIIKNIDKLPKGLKGLIYYKLSQIEDKIKINLLVKSKLKEFDKLASKDNRNILKIIGVLLDNAIESAVVTEEKYLFIEFEIINHCFKICIINSNSNKIEKNKIMELGVSSKGKNRGYGLSLVKDIIRNDERYNIEFEQNTNEFNTVFTFLINN